MKRYEIEGMTCGHCVSTVKKTLAKVKGIEAIGVKIGSAEIEGTADDADVIAALREQGYEARLSP